VRSLASACASIPPHLSARISSSSNKVDIDLHLRFLGYFYRASSGLETSSWSIRFYSGLYRDSDDLQRDEEG